MNTEQKRSIDRKGFRYILYFLVVSIFLSPYFTPPSTVGPEGIIRLDQVVLVLLVLYVVFRRFPEIRIEFNIFTICVLGLAVIIFASYLNGILNFGYPNRLGDVYDVFIWFAYFSLVAVLIGTFSIKMIRKTIYVIILGAFFVSLLGLLQILDLWSSIDIVQTLYAPGKYATSGRVDAVETNPNVYAHLLVIPTITLGALAVRWALSYARRQQTFVTYRWKAVFIFFVFVLAFSNIFYTYSRAVFVGMVAGVGIIGVMYVVGSNSWRESIYYCFGGLLVGALLLVLLNQLDLGIQFGRYTNLSDLSTDSSFQTRLKKWEQGFPVLLETFLLGHGPNKQGLFQVGISHIDNGMLSWWYHYGTLGLFFITAAWLSVLRYGFQIAQSRIGFSQHPLIWSFSIGTLGYTIGVPLMWMFHGLIQFRRSFTLYLLSIVLIISYYQKIQTTASETRAVDENAQRDNFGQPGSKSTDLNR